MFAQDQPTDASRTVEADGSGGLVQTTSTHPISVTVSDQLQSALTAPGGTPGVPMGQVATRARSLLLGPHTESQVSRLNQQKAIPLFCWRERWEGSMRDDGGGWEVVSRDEGTGWCRQ